MTRFKSKKPKQRNGLIRSVSSMLLGISKSVDGPSINSARKSADLQRKVSLQRAPKQEASVVSTMQTIIQSQQDEIMQHLEASSDLKNDLKASEKRVEMLKDTIEDFATALYASRDETRDIDRQYQKLKDETQQRKDEGASKPLTQNIAAFNMKQQAASYEREMRALVSQMAAAQDDVAQHYAEITALNDTLASVTIHSRELSRRNEALALNNTELRQCLSELDCTSDPTLATLSTATNETDFASEDGVVVDDQPVGKELAVLCPVVTNKVIITPSRRSAFDGRRSQFI